MSETRKEVGLKLSRRDKGGERTRENVDLGVFVGWESLERSQSACQRDKYTMSSTEKQRELQSDWLATPIEIESYPINQSHGNDETGADRVSAHGQWKCQSHPCGQAEQQWAWLRLQFNKSNCQSYVCV